MASLAALRSSSVLSALLGFQLPCNTTNGQNYKPSFQSELNLIEDAGCRASGTQRPNTATCKSVHWTARVLGSLSFRLGSRLINSFLPDCCPRARARPPAPAPAPAHIPLLKKSRLAPKRTFSSSCIHRSQSFMTPSVYEPTTALV